MTSTPPTGNHKNSLSLERPRRAGEQYNVPCLLLTRLAPSSRVAAGNANKTRPQLDTFTLQQLPMTNYALSGHSTGLRTPGDHPWCTATIKGPTSSALPLCWRTSPFFPSSVRDMHAPMLFLGLRNPLTQGAQVLENLRLKGARFAVCHRVLSQLQCFLMVFLRHFSMFAIKSAITALLNFIGSVTVR